MFNVFQYNIDDVLKIGYIKNAPTYG